jgi:hypothetical protein
VIPSPTWSQRVWFSRPSTMPPRQLLARSDPSFWRTNSNSEPPVGAGNRLAVDWYGKGRSMERDQEGLGEPG